MSHPNVVPLHGATLDPPQLVSDWMQDLTGFIKEHPNASRLGLVRAPTARMALWNPHPFASYVMPLRA